MERELNGLEEKEKSVSMTISKLKKLEKERLAKASELSILEDRILSDRIVFSTFISFIYLFFLMD